MTMENDNDNAQELDTSVDSGVDTSADTSTVVDTDTSADTGPKSMLEAIEAAVPAVEKAPEDEVKPVVEAKDGEKKPDAKPEGEEDLTKMPEGLSKGAQERFQKLANDNKAVRGELEHMQSVIAPFQEALQTNGVRKEQFDMATQYIGLVNRGDLDGAYKLMEGELRQLSLLMGKSVGGVDVLAEFPDLREQVDTFQITEERALELAKHRNNENVQVRQRQAQDQQQQQAQQFEQAKRQGIAALDAFEKKMKSTDIDYARVEAILMPKLERIIRTSPPHEWVERVQDAYDLIKSAGGASRTAPSNTQSLRPTGAASPSQAPKTMAEAMWGNNL